MSADGSFTVHAWPARVHCISNNAKDATDAIAQSTRDFHGTWDKDSGEVSHIVTFFFDNQVCPGGGATATVWRQADQSLSMTIPIAVKVDPDVRRPDQSFVLGRSPRQ